MLLNINVKNFLLIEELNLDLEPGLIAITGETGAGKSMLVSAILYCLGDKNSNAIRLGKEFCSVTLTLSMSDEIIRFLQDNDIAREEHLIITRSQNIQGKKRLLINGQIVSLKTLQELSQQLMDVYGQNTHTDLFYPRHQLEILDQYAANHNLVSELAKYYQDFIQARSQIQNFLSEQSRIDEEIDYLLNASQEIMAMNVQDNEEHSLAIERIELQKKIKNQQAAVQILNMLNKDKVVHTILNAQKQLSNLHPNEEATTIDIHLEKAIENIDKAIAVLSKSISYDDGAKDLSIIEERLFLIRDLSRKYKVTPDKLSELLMEYEQTLASLEAMRTTNENLTKQIDEVKANYLNISKQLTASRNEAANDLTIKVNKELKELEMIFAQFNITIEKLNEDNLTAYGLDKVDFVASMNPGSAKVAIAKTASGGELSRLMLAIMVSAMQNKQKPIIIFDEIDSGTSGIAAQSISQKLKTLSDKVQVIVITHQPQIAGVATQHLLAHKALEKEETVTSIQTISDKDRVSELARMIAGKNASEQIHKAASEMIKKS